MIDRQVVQQWSLRSTSGCLQSYEIGTAFGHLAIGVPDVAAVCDSVRAAGGKVTREPGSVKGGTSFIAFVQDPDGYKVELIQV